MSTRIKPVAVDLGFETVTLLYDFNALAEITEILTPDELARLGAGNSKAQPNISLKTIRAMVWAGCLHERPNATQMDIGRMIDPTRLAQVGLAMAAALTEHMQDKGTGPGGDSPENPTTATAG